MNKQLKQELDQALQGLGGAAVPLTDEEVHRMIAEIKTLTARIVAWHVDRSPRR